MSQQHQQQQQELGLLPAFREGLAICCHLSGEMPVGMAVDTNIEMTVAALGVMVSLLETVLLLEKCCTFGPHVVYQYLWMIHTRWHGQHGHWVRLVSLDRVDKMHTLAL